MARDATNEALSVEGGFAVVAVVAISTTMSGTFSMRHSSTVVVVVVSPMESAIALVVVAMMAWSCWWLAAWAVGGAMPVCSTVLAASFRTRGHEDRVVLVLVPSVDVHHEGSSSSEAKVGESHFLTDP